MRAVLRPLMITFVFGLVPLSVFAQLNTGGITGTLRDASGAVIPGAKVTATNQGTGLIQEVETTGTGLYAFKVLQVGNYTVAVAHPGFESFKRSDIQVVSGETVTVDVTLQVGQATQTISVTGAAPTLDTTSANLGVSRASQEISDLPVYLFGNSARTAASLAETFAGVNFNPNEAG